MGTLVVTLKLSPTKFNENCFFDFNKFLKTHGNSRIVPSSVNYLAIFPAAVNYRWLAAAVN
jgi:hypothetical protein